MVKTNYPGVSVLAGRVVALKQTDNADVLFRTHDNADIASFLRDYFQLDRVCLRDCYARWSADSNFQAKATKFWGVRMLRQDPFENLISFICSSNNNIARISMMIDKLCESFGTPLGLIDGRIIYNFPTPSQLQKVPDLEERLRDLGFGYRSKFIKNTVDRLLEINEDNEKKAILWLYSLREMEYDDAKKALLQFDGIGPKVADCILLMSLDKHESIPVDTHVLSLATRDYGVKMMTKSLTPSLYDDIGKLFRDKFSPFAGWAHSVLFAADLSKFSKDANQIKTQDLFPREDIKLEGLAATPKPSTASPMVSTHIPDLKRLSPKNSTSQSKKDDESKLLVIRKRSRRNSGVEE